MRVLVRLKERVDKEVLNRAVQLSAKRYPYFCRKVIRRGDDYEILHNEAPIPVNEGSAGICFGSEEANGHFLAVCFRDKNIWLDLYHSMADMKGFLPWVKTVVYLYLTEKTGKALPSDGIRLPGEAFLEGETEDPFADVLITDDIYPLFQVKPAKNFFPDRRYAEGPGRIRYYMTVSEAGLMELAKENDGSPVAASSFFVKEMFGKLFPDREGLPVVAGIAHSLRDLCRGEENYHDQTTLFNVRFDERMNALPFDRQMTCCRGQIILQGDPENMLYEIRRKAEFANKLDALKTAEEKRNLYRMTPDQVVNYPETFAISYLGKTDWGSITDALDGVFLSCRAMVSPIMIVIVPFRGSFCFTLIQRDDTSVYAETLSELFAQYGIETKLIGREEEELCTVSFP